MAKQKPTSKPLEEMTKAEIAEEHDVSENQRKDEMIAEVRQEDLVDVNDLAYQRAKAYAEGRDFE